VISAKAYAVARQASVLAESSVPRVRELEIQARLYNGDYGAEWTTTCGEKFRVLHFGEWNREAGPDFKNARIEFEKRGIEDTVMPRTPLFLIRDCISSSSRRARWRSREAVKTAKSRKRGCSLRILLRRFKRFYRVLSPTRSPVR